MTKNVFTKTLSANDVGATGGHQGGILIPKSETDLLAFLPYLNPKIKNPDAWIDCIDEKGTLRRLRFVYYNNKLHDENGTRNEYRITYLTRYFREVGAKEGDFFEISHDLGKGNYEIKLVRPNAIAEDKIRDNEFRIKIKTGWRRGH
jgi:hypothetical protein